MALTLAFSCGCCEFFINSFFFGTTLVAAFFLLEREEEESVEKGGRKNFLNERRKWKHFIYILPASFCASYNRNANITMQILEMLTLFFLLFLQVFFHLIPASSFFVFSFLTNWKISLVAFISMFRNRRWELFCKTAVLHDVTKIVNFFYKIGISF